MRSDVVVIGGGVVGLAVAMRLARGGRSVVLLERHESFGQETSSRNSEVIHAGMYYPTGSLKARLCVAGNRSLPAWCDAHAVPHARIGKFIVATADDEVATLTALLERAGANGVPRLRWAGGGELAEAEPHVRAVAALYSPDTGIVDSHALMRSLRDAAADHGAVFAWGHSVVGTARATSGYVVRFTEPSGAAGSITAAAVVNAAGLEADQIAAGIGLDIDALAYRLVYVKGNYFRLSESWRGRLRHLVYPVPHHGLAGLGSHITLDLAGGVRVGPDVEPLRDRTADYSVDPERAGGFVAAVRRYLPELTIDQLRPDQSGIRGRRLLADASVSPDFVIAEESAHGLPRWINLIGIESPGLTACLEIGESVAQLLDE